MLQHGISRGRVAEALQMARATLWRRARRTGTQKKRVHRCRRMPHPDDATLLAWIKRLKAEHPYWGARRIRAYLLRKHRLRGLSRRRVNRLMKAHGLSAPRIRTKRTRRCHLPPPAPTAPNQLWEMDMTGGVTEQGERFYAIVIEDVYSRRIVGAGVFARCRAAEWVDVLDAALRREFPQGSRGMGLVLRVDNGCQPTSRYFVRYAAECGVRLQYTGYSSPRENGHVERLIRTLKEEVIWVREFWDLDEVRAAVSEFVEFYNGEYPHSALGYASPDDMKREWRLLQNAA